MKKLYSKLRIDEDNERDFYASFIKKMLEKDYTGYAIGEYLAIITDALEGYYA